MNHVKLIAFIVLLIIPLSQVVRAQDHAHTTNSLGSFHVMDSNVCPISGGVSILNCGACTASQYTHTIAKSETFPCDLPLIGTITADWTETWKHDIRCEAIGSGTCGTAMICTKEGWIVNSLSGNLTEEVEVDHAMRISRTPPVFTSNCHLPPVPAGRANVKQIDD